MAGLAAVTEQDQDLRDLPDAGDPAGVRRADGNTIDSISHGRFGLNLITGWQRPEYSQMGLWPGDEHFRNRYRCSPNTRQCCASCGTTGVSPTSRASITRWTIAGVEPAAAGDMKIICAGSCDEGLAFSAQYADYAFCLGKGVNTPTAFASNNDARCRRRPPRPAATSRSTSCS